MYNFVFKGRPQSYNNNTGALKSKYKAALEQSLWAYNAGLQLLHNDLYAVVYHFFYVDLCIDTDNLSKPVWDSLNGILYNDDKQIKVRIAGSFNLTAGDYNRMDFTGLQGKVVVDLLDALDNEDHVVYVECGNLGMKMYKFNLE